MNNIVDEYPQHISAENGNLEARKTFFFVKEALF